MWVAVKVCMALLLCIGATEVQAAARCTAAQGNNKMCADCTRTGICNAVTGLVDPGQTACLATQVCKQIGTSALCVSAVGDTFCNNCGAGFKGCDPYDPLLVHVCVSGKSPQSFGPLCAATSPCQAGACPSTQGPTTSEPCRGGTAGVFTIKTARPSCTSGVLCDGSTLSSTINCTDGQYFDEVSGSCRSLPVNPCEGQLDGLEPNLTDCTRVVVCQSGVVVEDFYCGDGQAFDSTNVACTVSTDPAVKCPRLNGCTFKSYGSAPSANTTVPSSAITSTPPPLITTTQPPICGPSTANKRYPFAGNCKKYWVCRLVGSTTYQYVDSTCTGMQVFNPAIASCDQPMNVPGCVEGG